ncbi:MAG: SRPBCC domain-containing protein [Gammaproteobacteria bacterium]|nr:SRPBCC domain-containing protein [Gammaproteobacteria bacterium]
MQAEVNNDGSIKLRIVREFAHPREKVFEAWLEPDQLAQWMGPEGVTMSDIAVNAVEGGHYHMQFNDPDGSVHRLNGVYREITRFTRLAFTWTWEPPNEGADEETLVTLDFETTPRGTRLTLVHQRFSSIELRDRHDWGWNSTLDKLEQNAPIMFR